MTTIAILGASGLIGQSVAEILGAQGFEVAALARRFAPSQRASLGGAVIKEAPLVDLDVAKLRDLLDRCRADVVVNCVGVLQDAPDGAASAVHEDFVARVAAASPDRLVVHISIPAPDAGQTTFSRTKAAAETALRAGDCAFAILRPGFVVAPIAYGGGALLRALAMFGLGLPRELGAAPFMITAVRDIADTIATLARRFRAGERDMRFVWDVMSPEHLTVDDVGAAFRWRLGGPSPAMRMPAWLLTVGGLAGDAAGRLGWRPPTRSTAIAEIQRGVSGDPRGWMDASGLAPHDLAAAMRSVGASVQEKWFARLYLWKGAAIAGLALFWIATGAIALTVGFDEARALMAQAMELVGGSEAAATTLTIGTSLLDIALGCAIAWRRWSRAGIVASLAVTLAYVGAGTLLAPALWGGALGPFLKDLPLLLATLAALAISDDR
ncbi:MAG: SDR family oxidoreductase [Rhodoblastus sp.]|nr:SDR family oxidoreductase [Rhodoblastus sp.]